MFILDTDHISILESRKGTEFDNLVRRIAKYDRSDLYVSIVSFHERVTGWNRYLAKATTAQETVKGYQRLEKLLKNFCHQLLIWTLTLSKKTKSLTNS